MPLLRDSYARKTVIAGFASQSGQRNCCISGLILSLWAKLSKNNISGFSYSRWLFADFNGKTG